MTLDELLEDIALEEQARDKNDADIAVTQQALEAERANDEIPY